MGDLSLNLCINFPDIIFLGNDIWGENRCIETTIRGEWCLGFYSVYCNQCNFGHMFDNLKNQILLHTSRGVQYLWSNTQSCIRLVLSNFNLRSCQNPNDPTLLFIKCVPNVSIVHELSVLLRSGRSHSEEEEAEISHRGKLPRKWTSSKPYLVGILHMLFAKGTITPQQVRS